VWSRSGDSGRVVSYSSVMRIMEELPVVLPESPALAEEPSHFQKQTTRINIHIDSDILALSGEVHFCKTKL
jgi:hypothetical protein